MKHAQTIEIIRKLKAKKVKFEHGLSDEEVQQIENKFNLRFPPDLQYFLQKELPISNGFVNWRLSLQSKSETMDIRKRIDWPFSGIVFDIEHNAFWMEEWGEKSNDLNKNIMVAEIYYETYPKMIPIYSHRYIPSEPYKTGNPVFSIYQTDIIYYGYDLAHYFAHEFRFELSDKFPIIDAPNHIDFWGDIES
ncbi:SMI1/KNR4 family protein [Psychrobacter sp. SWN149]|uniref:SMI1/KNR4 family protein n=1 Tax=Psychrobacter sp. SWN149 TaxID=2792057 RepID=UPI0018CF4BB5|nr:SMI1/KNR4 family protein [Psychrobacter sp. SWN149]MBH0006904.1 SMI1/KNR4 family protein [Psychrobacter sp. SWN149]